MKLKQLISFYLIIQSFTSYPFTLFIPYLHEWTLSNVDINNKYVMKSIKLQNLEEIYHVECIMKYNDHHKYRNM